MTWVFCFLVGLLSGLWLATNLPLLLLRWRDAAHRAWRRRSCRHRGGRPRLDPELIALIRRMSLENPLWGAPRIHGELLKLGLSISQSSVSKYMLRRLGRPTQTWTTFLRNHTDEIAAIDMLTVRTALFQRLFAFVALAHDRRRILHVEVTDHPTALWLSLQIAAAFAIETPQFLVRDNDRAYGLVFRRRVRAMGVRDRPTQPHSPWQNGHVERVIGSIRRECLDHLIIFNAGHLRRVLNAYAEYYNCDRTHLALAKDSPLGRRVESAGRIISRPAVGGLHRRYARMQP